MKFALGAASILLLALSPAHSADDGKHLFILSGQSNMAGMKPELSFTPTVTKAFGKDNIIVTKSAYSGASIRSWAKSNHEFPPPHPRPRAQGERPFLRHPDQRRQSRHQGTVSQDRHLRLDAGRVGPQQHRLRYLS